MMKKLSTLFALLIFSIGQMFAYECEVDGIYYEITYDDILGEDALCVTSRGWIDDPSYSGDIVIPATVTHPYNGITYKVTSIDRNAFYECDELTSVTIPKGVTSIGERAFYHCGNLKSVTIPEGVTSIGYEAFCRCESLTSATIPNSVTNIEERAFFGCESLTSVAIPEGMTIINSGAFNDCMSLTSVTIPSSVTSIGERAFSHCESLTSITIPSSVKSIGDYAFECCDLKSVIIPNGVESIGGDAFNSNGNLSSITIPNSVTSIGPGALAWCAFTSITIPNSVTSIGASAFEYNWGLTSITIPNSVTSIGEYAFTFCEALTSVTIPEGVTSIGNNAFWYCSGLTSVTIPSSVESIGDEAFSECNNLANVYNYATTPQTISDNVFTHYGTLHVQDGYEDVYKNAEVWKNFHDIVIQTFDDVKKLALVTLAEILDGTEINDTDYIAAINAAEDEDGINAVLDAVRLAKAKATAIATVNALFADYANAPASFVSDIEAATTTDAIYSILTNAQTFAANADTFSLGGNKYILEEENDAYSVLGGAMTFGDGSAYSCPVSVSVDELTYTRTYSSTNWQALYVPFAISCESDDYTVAKIYAIIDYDDDEDGEFDRTNLVVKMMKFGSTKPNVPYLIRAKETGKCSIVIEDCTLEPTASNSVDCSTTEYTYTFTGNYSPVTTMYENNYFAMADGTLCKASKSGVTLPAQRWYMSVTPRSSEYAASRAQNISIIVDGEEGVEGIETPAAKRESAVAYDLQGRAVNAAFKGISIVNGKKVIR